MQRRSLLSAVAAGGLAGCVSGQPTPQVVGLDERQVDTAHCGQMLNRPCGFVTGMSSTIQRPVQIREEFGGVATVYRKSDRLVVRGYILGIGDRDCADGRVSRVALTDGTLFVSVRNNRANPSWSGCEESTGVVRYRVAVAPSRATVRRVRVTHYDDDGEVILSGVVDAPER